jgi:hypothetical protein
MGDKSARVKAESLPALVLGYQEKNWLDDLVVKNYHRPSTMATLVSCFYDEAAESNYLLATQLLCKQATPELFGITFYMIEFRAVCRGAKEWINDSPRVWCFLSVLIGYSLRSRRVLTFLSNRIN